MVALRSKWAAGKARRRSISESIRDRKRLLEQQAQLLIGSSIGLVFLSVFRLPYRWN
jgi:hypothetical protein